MMLVMLTPSLACAMPTCDQAAPREAASIPTTKTTAPPCADHTGNHAGDHNDQKAKTGKTLNLLKDCMGVDLQVADGVSLHQPDLQAAPVFIMAAHHDVPGIGPDARADGIRGPPPDWPAIRALQPALIFSTQRFRI